VQPTVTPAPSLETRDALVLEHLPLARAIAVRVYENLPVHVDLDDLVHAGVMGLFDAALKFDAGKQISFKTFAKHRIKGSILDSLRGLDWASRDLRRRHKQLEEITRQFVATQERTPTEAEVAEQMGMDLDRWRQVSIDMRMVGLLSASTRGAESEDQSAPEFPATDALNPDVLAGQRQLQSVLALAIRELPERYQRVIREYYANGKTMKEIGELMGVNESRISQIHRAALDRMGQSLQAVGIHSAECVL